MAIKLVDIVTVMKDKWTYGDKFFGYTEEFNNNHSTFYPSLLITPPDSVFPEVGLNNGWENYTFEVYFSDKYNRTAQSFESIELRWQNLQDLATEWLDLFLKYYQAEAPVTGFLEDESVVLERKKEVANDQLLQIKMTFTWRVLSKCFRPQSTYPNQIDNSLGLWLSADSGTTFKISTKQVSEWKDRSDRANNFSQTVVENQPLRYTYQSGGISNQDNFGIFNGKTRLNFPNGKKDYLECKTNANSPLVPTTNSFTIFIAASYNIDISDPNIEAVLSVKNNNIPSFGSMALGKKSFQYYEGVISDGLNTINLTSNDFTEQSVSVWQINKETGNLWVNGVLKNTQTVAGFDITGKFILSDWYVGWNSVIDKAFNGDVAEIIVYDSALGDYKRKQVENYLNNKYRIY